jgi:Tol biopolymer transport system component
MNADGSGLRTVARNVFHPAWSPDGRKFAFVRGGSGYDSEAEIYVINTDGSNEHRLTQNTASDTVPAWSPDGRKIAFNSERDGNTEIYVMNADGSDPRNLTRTATDDGFPLTGELVSPHSSVWSPDGRTIAFMRGFEDFTLGIVDGTQGIYLMNADGNNQRLLTHAAAGDFAWSPNGRQIAFGGGLRGGPLYIVNADGSGRRTLVRTRTGSRLWAPVSLAWSPDGRKIAFTDGEVNVMNADGSGRRTLTHSRNLERFFAWSPALK